MLGEAPVAIALARRSGDEAANVVAGLGRLFAAGAGVDWQRFFAGTGTRRTDLPTYAFDHHRYWIADGSLARIASVEASAVAPVDLSLAERLAQLPVTERAGHLLDLICEQTAVVLGHAAPDAIDPGRAFHEIGLDSLTAVELRDWIARLSGLSLPATLIFDHPSPAALADYVLDALGTLPGTDAAADNTATAPDSDLDDVSSLDDLFALVDGELGPQAS
jgi:acyl transferase domain-containing protein